MKTKVIRAPDGSWTVLCGTGPLAFSQAGFASKEDGERWAEAAAPAAVSATIRIGHKRFLATPTEALRRWAIDQGTLYAERGGTDVSPARRLAGLAAEPELALPVPLVDGGILAAVRQRRQADNANWPAIIAETAALAAAIDMLAGDFREDLERPTGKPAPDGLFILSDSEIQTAMDLAAALDPEIHLLLSLCIDTGLSEAALRTVPRSAFDPASSSLTLGSTQVSLSGRTIQTLATQTARAAIHECPLVSLDQDHTSSKVAALSARADLGRLTPDTFALNGLYRRYKAGLHLDEGLIQTGAALPVINKEAA